MECELVGQSVCKCISVHALFILGGSPTFLGIGWCCDNCWRCIKAKFVRIYIIYKSQTVLLHMPPRVFENHLGLVPNTPSTN
jgi:hypothetical protein